MYTQLLKDGLGWGVVLWFIGYMLGIVLFMVVPIALIGWVITPIGILMTVWVLLKKVKNHTLHYLLKIGSIWTFIAIVFDYFFLVKLFNPADGYYKLDVYLYYALTLLLPLFVGWHKSLRR